MTDWFTDVPPFVRIPSTGIVSPASTVSVSPTLTSSAGTITSSLPRLTRAVLGVSFTSPSIPFLARAEVQSSRSEPICMMMATSPAANHSLVAADATSAMDTSMSAFTLRSMTSALQAPVTIGVPQRIMAVQAMSKGSSSPSAPERLSASETAPRITQKSVTFVSFSSQRLSIFPP